LTYLKIEPLNLWVRQDLASTTFGFAERRPNPWLWDWRGARSSVLYIAHKPNAVYAPHMSSVHEIETAITKLSRQELLAFRNWFSEFDAAMWDKQFEEDVAAGHLDALADDAIRDLREGRCRDL
jgi:hypothetical protein